MKSRVKRNPANPRRKNKGKTTFGQDNMVSNTSRKDYFVSGALEMTPHPNQRLRAALGRPIMNPELKYSVIETSITGNHLTSASPTQLVSIAQGDTDITRDGDRCKIKRVWATGKIYGNASQTGPVSARLVIAVWNPAAVAVNIPVASQVIQASQGYLPYGAYSKDFGDCYQILYDGLFSITQLSATQEADIFHFDREVDIDLQFNAGGTAPVVNGLMAWLMTDTATNQPSVNAQITLWFKDIVA